MAIPNYEVLIWPGGPGLTRRYDWSMKGMKYGEGYGSSVLTGHPDGLVTWKVNYTAHRDIIPPARYDHNQLLPFQPRLYSFQRITPSGSNDGGSNPVSRYAYLRDFVKRRMAASNEPFFFEDIDAAVTGVAPSQNFSARSYYICQLRVPSIEFSQDSERKLIYRCSFEFQQVRGWPAPSA